MQKNEETDTMGFWGRREAQDNADSGPSLLIAQLALLKRRPRKKRYAEKGSYSHTPVLGRAGGGAHKKRLDTKIGRGGLLM